MLEDALTLAKQVDHQEVVICPPHIFTAAISKVLKKASTGAQDGFYEPHGPFTGYVSMAQLAAVGVKHVIIGHSERRALGEEETVIARKIAAAFEAGLTPIVCIGETAEEHKQGKVKEVVDRQVRSAFSLLPAGSVATSREAIICYEPVWAISTNQVPGMETADTPEQAQTVARYLEGIVRGMPVTSRFIYGGSVNQENLAAFLICPEFSGVLVGGASLRVPEFKKMIKIAEHILM